MSNDSSIYPPDFDWSILPKRSNRIHLKCITCDVIFWRVPAELKRGENRGLYCSLSCRGRAGAEKRTSNLIPKLQERLFRYIEKVPGGCWIWRGRTDTGGYGSVTRNNRPERVHRHIYTLMCGPIPAGLHVLHKCDIPSCCNPAHLWIGTHADNMADMARKGRSRRPYSKQGKCNASKTSL